MARKPDLKDAYALGGVEDVKALYGDWAESYDTGFAAAREYALHEAVAAGYAAAGGDGPVLDVGAGTGLVGAALAARGVGPIHGTDISAEMLAAAEAKGVYARVFLADITEPLEVADGAYGGIVSAGTFTMGHVGPEPLAELVRITRAGGILAISVKPEHFEAAGFAAVLARLGPRVEELHRAPVRIYAPGAAHDHGEDESLLLTLRVA